MAQTLTDSQHQNPSQVLEATSSFVTELDGRQVVINAEHTRIAADHELAKRFPQHFRPVEDGMSFRTEEATAEPSVPRNRPQPDSSGSSSGSSKARSTTPEEK